MKGPQIALLRGVNVGGHMRIDMQQLRALVSDLGYEDVKTSLMSGNVLMTAATKPDVTARRIEEALKARLNVSVRVLVRTRDELAEVVKRNPLRQVATDPARLLVIFLSASPDPRTLRQIDPAGFAPEVFRVIDREVYLWSPLGLRAVKLNFGFWEKRFQLVATGRNWNTVTRLLAMAGGEMPGQA